MLLNSGVEEDSWESLGLQGDPTSPSWRKSTLNVHWKDWCWSWNSNTLATWCEELTHLKRPCCWERLRAGGEGDDRGCDGWMASLTQWTWVWIDSGSWWWTGRPGMLKSIGSQSRTWMSNWTELNWTELNCIHVCVIVVNSSWDTARDFQTMNTLNDPNLDLHDAAVHGIAKSRTQLSNWTETELNWT